MIPYYTDRLATCEIRQCAIGVSFHCSLQLVDRYPERRVRLILVYCKSQWSSSNVPDCCVRGPRFESHRGHVYRKNHYDIHCSLGHGLYTLLQCLGRLSLLPLGPREMVKWVSAFGLSNNNKWRRWVWLLAAYRQPTGSLQADSQPWSFGLVWGSAAVPYSSYEPGELSQWLSLRWQHHRHHHPYYYYYYYY